MGKNGSVMRAQKQQHGYFYTNAQIAEIKRQAIESQRERLHEETRKFIEEEFERRSEMIKGDTTEETMQMVLALLMSIPTKILVEKFHWKPITDESDNRSNLKKFSEEVVNETNAIFSDDHADIRQYIEQCYKKYGVKFEIVDENT